MAGLIDKLFDKYQVAIVGLRRGVRRGGLFLGHPRAGRDGEKGQLKDVPAFQQAFCEKLRPALDNDGLFAKAIKGKPVVLGYYLNSEKDAKRIAAIPEPVLPKGTFAGTQHDLHHLDGYGGNLPEFLKNAAAARATSTRSRIPTAWCGACR